MNLLAGSLFASLFVLLMVTPSQAAAQNATRADSRAVEPLGRLFFTPAQRVQLDIARRQRARTTVATEQTEETAQSIPQTIRYDGLVRRSDGKSTIWLNSRPIEDQKPVGGAAIVGRIHPDGSIRLQVPQSGRAVDLKPGQRVELLSGEVEEGYTRSPVTPTKPPAKPAATPGPASSGGALGNVSAAADRFGRARRPADGRDEPRRETGDRPVASSGAGPAPVSDTR